MKCTQTTTITIENNITVIHNSKNNNISYSTLRELNINFDIIKCS